MFLNLKNPKIDVRGTNLFNLIRSKKDFFWIKFIFGHDNPGFKCSKNMSCDEININNELDGLVQYSVGMSFKNWYSVSDYDRLVQLRLGIGSNQLINAIL